MPVDIHPVRLDVPEAEITQYARLLSEAESARADRFRFPHLSRRFTVAHGELRLILARYLGSEPRSVPMAPTVSGKPQLDPNQNPANIQFSLSHTGDLAVIAVSIGFAVGVDVENTRVSRLFCRTGGPLFYSRGSGIGSISLFGDTDTLDDRNRSGDRILPDLDVEGIVAQSDRCRHGRDGRGRDGANRAFGRRQAAHHQVADLATWRWTGLQRRRRADTSNRIRVIWRVTRGCILPRRSRRYEAAGLSGLPD